jgi:predicted RNA-binding Zn-ribbon protein involved in translation (DUF1610 family)
MNCPRCGAELREPLSSNALSRKDNKTYICSQCGIEEAMEDYRRARRKADES